MSELLAFAVGRSHWAAICQIASSVRARSDSPNLFELYDQATKKSLEVTDQAAKDSLDFIYQAAKSSLEFNQDVAGSMGYLCELLHHLDATIAPGR
jgi:hypothetical protein